MYFTFFSVYHHFVFLDITFTQESSSSSWKFHLCRGLEDFLKIKWNSIKDIKFNIREGTHDHLFWNWQCVRPNDSPLPHYIPLLPWWWRWWWWWLSWISYLVFIWIQSRLPCKGSLNIVVLVSPWCGPFIVCVVIS